MWSFVENGVMYNVRFGFAYRIRLALERSSHGIGVAEQGEALGSKKPHGIAI